MLNNKQKIKKIDKLYFQFTKKIELIRNEILQILREENKAKNEQKIREIKQEINKID